VQAHPYLEGALPYNSIEAVNWSKRGNLLATGGWDSTDAVTYGEEFVIKLWDVSTLYED
jgi:hypothetical protein